MKEPLIEIKKISKEVIVIIIAGILVPFFLYILTEHEPREDIKEVTFARLAKIRSREKPQVIKYFDNVRNLVSAIENDKVMLNSFDVIWKNNFVTDSKSEREVDKHYVDKYGDSFDILFVRSTGFVFHSIKKESDYRKNLFEGSLLATKLAQEIDLPPLMIPLVKLEPRWNRLSNKWSVVQGAVQPYLDLSTPAFYKNAGLCPNG